MALSSEVDDPFDVVGGEERVDQFGVANISADQTESGIMLRLCERHSVPAVGERIEADDVELGVLDQKVTDEIGADETGRSGDEKHFAGVLRCEDHLP